MKRTGRNGGRRVESVEPMAGDREPKERRGEPGKECSGRGGRTERQERNHQGRLRKKRNVSGQLRSRRRRSGWGLVNTETINTRTHARTDVDAHKQSYRGSTRRVGRLASRGP